MCIYIYTYIITYIYIYTHTYIYMSVGHGPEDVGQEDARGVPANNNTNNTNVDMIRL